MVQSNEDVRIWASDMSEMRLKSDSTKSKQIWMCFIFSLDPLTTESELKRVYKETPAFQYHIHCA